MLTICYTMFNPKQETIVEHLTLWKSYSEEAQQQLKIVIIDDHSDKVVNIQPDFSLNLNIVRVDQDIYWNLPGARNLAFKLADDDWCVSLDMDHFLSPKVIEEILKLEKHMGTVYRFQRTRNGKPHTVHRDSFIIHKKDFWDMGGYDEDMCGCRGANEDLIEATMHYKNLILEQTNITIENNEFHGKVGGIKRDMVSRNYVFLKQKLYQMKQGIYENKDHIRFTWTPTRL